MNSTLFLHNGSDTTFTAEERHAPEFHDALTIKRKALERWENEGGRIPELSLRHQRNGFAGQNPPPTRLSDYCNKRLPSAEEIRRMSRATSPRVDANV